MNANPTVPDMKIRTVIMEVMDALMAELYQSVNYGSLADVAYSVVRLKTCLDGILTTYKMDPDSFNKFTPSKYPKKEDLFVAIAKEIKEEVEAWGKR